MRCEARLRSGARRTIMYVERAPEVATKQIAKRVSPKNYKMALHFVLDGYNIINRASALAKQKLEDSRESLIKWVEVKNPQGSFRNQVTIVFDGQSGVGGYHKSFLVKVLFSWEESADDLIKKIVSVQENKKSTVVVTDDREIQYYVRALGAQVLSVDEFFRRAQPPEVKQSSTKSKKNFQEEKKDISKTLESKINAEFEKIWLEKKSKGDS